MFAMMDVLHDGNEQSLVFCSREDAINFRSFANAYMARGGNGYGAYWVYGDEEIIGVDRIPKSSKVSLDGTYVDKMHKDIQKRNRKISVNISSGQKRGAICFEFSTSKPVKTVAKTNKKKK